ncbi:MAG: hypothetical protein QOE82_1119, partial [Thermoanaerobaculia bacterium]|nr:hypothetical protein [Thermoanaerobaculia bacterium]
EQHVLKYRLTIFSPEMIGAEDTGAEPIVAIQVLRSKIYRIMQNIDTLREVPGSELVRSKDGMSLVEIRLRLEEITRFKLEPLTGRIATTGLIANRPGAVRFLESQLAYDQRMLKATQDYAETIRQAFAVYSLDRGFGKENLAEGTATPRDAAHPQQQPQRSDTLMPQINDSFLDRLVTLTSQSSDVEYRQKLVDDYRHSAQSAIPAQAAVAYDQEVLSLVKSSSAAPLAGDAQAVRGEITATSNEVKKLLGSVNNIYDAVSANLSPSKELFTLTAPPIVRTEHSRSLTQIALYGIALLAFLTPVIIILCLIHARVREEEASEMQGGDEETV